LNLRCFVAKLIKEKEIEEIKNTLTEFPERFKSFKQITIDGYTFTRDENNKFRYVGDPIPF